MRKSDLFQKWNVHLDLAVEAHELLRRETNENIPGVVEKKETFKNASVNIITITDKRGEKLLGRPPGNYITLEAPEIKDNNFENHKKISEVLAQKISELIEFRDNTSFLIIGLGNSKATPDALGPKVAEKILVTRHLFNFAPEEIKGNLRNVAAISPGVLGITGIETAEVIRGLVEHVRPDYVIAIDALAAGALERIGTSIQIADTGINPGSGIGNFRKGLNEQTLGCKVIGIGVPTVVNAAVIAHKTIEELFSHMEAHPELAKIYNEENEDSIMEVMQKALSPYKDSLMVTPKEVDDLIETTSRIIANALNMSIHPGIDLNNFETYLM